MRAMYTADVKSDRISAMFLTILIKNVNGNLRYSSSGDLVKSKMVAGRISTFGEPLTMTAILPRESSLATLSGLSVTSI